jgi:hypothetical protein
MLYILHKQQTNIHYAFMTCVHLLLKKQQQQQQEAREKNFLLVSINNFDMF